MGEYAEYELARQYPEVFGEPRNGRRWRDIEAPVTALPVVRIGNYRFKGLTSGEISAYAPGVRMTKDSEPDLSWGEMITRSVISKSFAKGHPRELVAQPDTTRADVDRKARIWLAWKGIEMMGGK
jgi:hypothetical protein